MNVAPVPRPTLDGPTVQLSEIFDDGQAKAQAAEPGRVVAVSLPDLLETKA